MSLEGPTVRHWLSFSDQSVETLAAFLFQHGSSQGKVTNTTG
jgi:hypothetical protein